MLTALNGGAWKGASVLDNIEQGGVGVFSRFFFYWRRWDGVMDFMLMCREKNKRNPAEERPLDGDKAIRAVCVLPVVIKSVRVSLIEGKDLFC